MSLEDAFSGNAYTTDAVRVPTTLGAAGDLLQDSAIAIKNFPAHSRDADGAKGLGFQMGLVVSRGDNLHPPQSGEQYAQTSQHDYCHQSQVRVILFELIENNHY